MWSTRLGGNDGSGDDDPELRRDVPLVLEGIEFETASADIKPESEVILRRVLRTLKRYPEVEVEISGHTDNVGRCRYEPRPIGSSSCLG